MKKLICILALAVSTAACAGPGHHGHKHGPGVWFTSLIVGGALGYVYSQSQRPVQVMPQYGTIYSQPIPMNPPMQPVYQEVIVYNSDCLCYQKQYRQIGWQ